MSALFPLYRFASIPRDLWEVRRDAALLTPANQNASRAVERYLGREEWESRAQGHGMTFIGPPKSGKTFWACQVLMERLARSGDLLWMLEGQIDILRVDYQWLASQSHFTPDTRLFSLVENARLLFVDNLWGVAPSPRIHAALSFRRDMSRATLLAFQADTPRAIPPPLLQVLTLFSDVNVCVGLEESILPSLRSRDE